MIGSGCQATSAKKNSAPPAEARSATQLRDQARRQRHDPDEAVKLLREAIAMEPENAGLQLDLGAALLELGRYGEAKEQLEAAAVLLPESPWPHYNLGWLYQELGRFEDAAKEYELALAHAPDERAILENLLLTYTRLGGHADRRLELVERAQLADPDPAWQGWLRVQRGLLLAFATPSPPTALPPATPTAPPAETPTEAAPPAVRLEAPQLSANEEVAL